MVNLTVLMVLKGEAAWICLMCCNADVLFSVLVLHWVTSKDNHGQNSMGDTSLRQVSGKRAGNLTQGPSSAAVMSDNETMYGTSRCEPQVTTRISAGEKYNGNVREDEIELDDRKESGGRWRVNVAQTVEQMELRRSPDREDDIADVIRYETLMSTDNLMER